MRKSQHQIFQSHMHIVSRNVPSLSCLFTPFTYLLCLMIFSFIYTYFWLFHSQKCWQCCTKEKTEQEKEVQLILKCDTTTKVASDLDCMRFIKVNWFWFPDWSRARIFKAKKVSLVVFRKVCWHFFWIERWRLCFWNCWTNFPSLKPWCICR